MHYNLIRLQHSLSTLSSPLSPKVSEVIKAELTPLFPSSNPDLKKLNEEFIGKHKDLPSHVQAGLQARQYLDPSSHAENQKELLALLDKENCTLEDAMQGLELTQRWKSNVKKYVTSACKRWPEASVFKEKSHDQGR